MWRRTSLGVPILEIVRVAGLAFPALDCLPDVRIEGEITLLVEQLLGYKLAIARIPGFRGGPRGFFGIFAHSCGAGSRVLLIGRRASLEDVVRLQRARHAAVDVARLMNRWSRWRLFLTPGHDSHEL